ncbi:MAG: transposase family protein [Syntrophobacteraceae bacterium]
MQKDLRHLIEGLALKKPPHSVASIYRQVEQIARQKGWECPTYRTFLNLVRKLDPGLLTLAHEGSKAYSESFDLIFRREATLPNDMWQADHCLLDIWLLDERGGAARPWLSVVLDDYSRAVPGYFLGFKPPDVLRTALMLRQAIWSKEDPRWHVCGIPDVFYTDNGSDYRSKHMEQVSADIKMQLVFSIPGRPQGRGKIERFFETVNQLFLCNLPGYTLDGKFPPGGAVLTLKELDTRFNNWLLSEYHLRIHSETADPPQERWERGAFLPRLPESAEQLDLLLLTVSKPRRIRKDGIHFQGFRYMSITLAGYVGEDVVIRYDPRDIAEIRVYHKDSFLCRATCQELSGETIGLKEIISARNRRRRELKDKLSDHAKTIDRFISVHDSDTPPHKTEVELKPPKPNPEIKRYFNE